MTDKKKLSQETLVETGKELWREWTVKLELKDIPANPPESGIGKRIAYCRGQMNNLSVEALARYTKFFDEVGVSRATLVRYESGDNTPGGRELRVLCETLGVSANWLLFGVMDSEDKNSEAAEILDRLKAYLVGRPKTGSEELADLIRDGRRIVDPEKRQQWIHEARQPKPRD